MKDNTMELEAMATHRKKWLAKDMNLVEEVTLRGRGVYAIEPGASVTLTPVELVEPELKPCPHCGGPAAVHIRGGTPERDHYGVRCEKCFSNIGTNQRYTQLEAVRAWNRRA